jgi:hypothetical protein
MKAAQFSACSDQAKNKFYEQHLQRGEWFGNSNINLIKEEKYGL